MPNKKDNPDYLAIKAHYEARFLQYGDTAKGMDWPNEEDALTRYQVMAEVLRYVPERLVKNKYSLLDFGCGTSLFYTFLESQNKLQFAHYEGLDISDEMVRRARIKYPNNSYHVVDAIREPEKIPACDFVVLNGVFTEKISLSFEDMWSWTQKMLRLIFAKANVGISCNFMSKQVDWEREDLFHLPLDQLAWFVTRELSRNFIVRNDYGLYEYTLYVYK